MQDHDLSRMTVLSLLPVIPLIVVSSSGGVMTSALLNTSPPLALFTLTVSVVLLIIGLSLTFMMLSSYVLRLIVHGLPQGALILSTFLPLGQAGQAGYSFLLIGRSFKAMSPPTGSKSEFLTSTSTGDVINILCICVAFALWSTAVMWLLFALLGVQNILRQGLPPFAVTFWGLLFPNVSLLNLLFPHHLLDGRTIRRECSQTSQSNSLVSSTPKFSASWVRFTLSQQSFYGWSF
jgi:hypothetical protein